ncbi:GNAT family N-acetyltransferase [Peribacillus simplex]|uniref:GNAT family N-acetyltransferase n=1 Tax=Peribacillus simplex TaxID=1478 RepID=UPI00298A0003|nr:GNAT family N-acetyltransferase [Peribacillus simplex]MBX9954129.1 GNAT family N-acetyltransferase [Peribacillus simplex]
MYKEQIIRDKETWNKIIEGFKTKDIYFINDYFTPFHKNGDGEPVLYYFECLYGKVAYPFMLRDIAVSENFIGIIDKNKYYDISSAYGYGGPLYECNSLEENIINLQKEFFSCFSKYCKKVNIISQFDRFHPLIKNHNFFDGYSKLSQIRKTVHIDLYDSEKLWENIDSKCKNMIRKAKKNAVQIILEDDLSTLEVFKYIYTSTMKQNDALEYYFFNNRFFDDTINNLEGNVFIANAYFEDKIIASSLILRHSEYLHYHFSGALKEYRNLQANNLLLYEVAKWGNENGYKNFHLGGGYESDSDSLYKFKKSFSKLEDNDFFIGKKIHDYDQYNYLKQILNKETLEVTSFFPVYRKR